MEDLLLEVLWIDDEPSDSFIDEAFNEGINITNCDNLKDGIRQIKDDSKYWDGIILDANCKVSRDEVEPNLTALIKAIKFLLMERVSTPWYVYTAKGIDWSDQLKSLINDEARVWDDRDYYNKPSQRYDLFTNIKKAAANRVEYSVRLRHASVCNFYKNHDLVELLMEYNKEGFDTDTSVPNRVRQIIEWVIRYLEGKGLLPIPFTGSNIARCSMALGDVRQLVPIQVARSLHFCVDICNDGSHDMEVSANIVSGEAPYLNKSLILNLLNILQWCPSLDKYDKEELRKKVDYYIKINKEEKEKRKKEKEK